MGKRWDEAYAYDHASKCHSTFWAGAFRRTLSVETRCRVLWRTLQKEVACTPARDSKLKAPGNALLVAESYLCSWLISRKRLAFSFIVSISSVVSVVAVSIVTVGCVVAMMQSNSSCNSGCNKSLAPGGARTHTLCLPNSTVRHYTTNAVWSNTISGIPRGNNVIATNCRCNSLQPCQGTPVASHGPMPCQRAWNTD